jgi:hypothetical protein
MSDQNNIEELIDLSPIKPRVRVRTVRNRETINLEIPEEEEDQGILIEKKEDEKKEDEKKKNNFEKKENIIQTKSTKKINYDIINKELNEIKNLNFYKIKKYKFLNKFNEDIEGSIKKEQEKIEDKYNKLIKEVKIKIIQTYLITRFIIPKGDINKALENVNSLKELTSHDEAKRITKTVLKDEIENKYKIFFSEHKYYFEILKNL